MIAYTYTLSSGWNVLSGGANEPPFGRAGVYRVLLAGGGSAAIVTFYDGTTGPPTVTHAATVAVGPNEYGVVDRYTYFKRKTTPASDVNVPTLDIPPGDPSGTSLEDPPSTAPDDPVQNDPDTWADTNYVGTTGYRENKSYQGIYMEDTVVAEDTASVPAQGAFAVAASGALDEATMMAFTRGIVVNATAACELTIYVG